MKTFTIIQQVEKTYFIEADTEEQAIRKMNRASPFSSITLKLNVQDTTAYEAGAKRAADQSSQKPAQKTRKA